MALKLFLLLGLYTIFPSDYFNLFAPSYNCRSLFLWLLAWAELPYHRCPPTQAPLFPFLDLPTSCTSYTYSWTYSSYSWTLPSH